MRLLPFLFLLAACGNDLGPRFADSLAATELRPLEVANETRPLLRWPAVPGAVRYRVEVGGIAVDVHATEHRVERPLVDGASVDWRVTAIGTGGAPLTVREGSFVVRVPPAWMPEFTVAAAPGASDAHRLFDLLDLGASGGPRLPAAVVVNRAGEVVRWYVHGEPGVLTDARELPNGRLLYIWRDPTVTPPVSRAFEATWDGEIVWASRPEVLVHHEVAPGPGDSYAYLTYLAEEFDGESIEGDGIEVVDPATGAVLWTWSIFDHFDPRARPTAEMTQPGISRLGGDWSHANAVVWDEARGLFWVCVRHFDAVLGIAYPSGDVRVVLGGPDGLGGPELFSHPHAPEVQPDGTLLFFDNGNTRAPPRSRVVQVAVDESAGTATEVSVWEDAAPFYAFALGDADRLANGNTLVTDGTNGRLVEFDAAGDVVWELRLATSGYWIYRADAVPVR